MHNAPYIQKKSLNFPVFNRELWQRFVKNRNKNVSKKFLLNPIDLKTSEIVCENFSQFSDVYKSLAFFFLIPHFPLGKNSQNL